MESNILIWAPKVFAIGQTQFNHEAFNNWIDHNDYNAVVNELDTPLTDLWVDVGEDDAIERMIEFGGRHCYRSWESGRGRAAYIKNIIDMEHGSVLEHSTINWAIQGVSRSLSLELARHRVGIALSQESQRYVDAKDINFVVPPAMEYATNIAARNAFHKDAMTALEKYKTYQAQLMSAFDLVHNEQGIKKDTMKKKRANEAARAILPNCTETRFLWTTNMRFLRHFFWLRGGTGADLEIRRLAVEMFHVARDIAPSVFADMTTKDIGASYGVSCIVAKGE